ncbi:MAG: glycosyltransferase family 2 protein [Chloroflexota bacterium]
MSLTIVIPAYNEENGIGPVLDHLNQVLEANSDNGFVYEILVVDDGSEDNTKEVALQYDNITVLQHRFNRGYGAGLKTGIRHASYDIICITDADGTYPNDQIPVLYNHFVDGSYDMVVGARTGENVSIPLVRRPAKWFIGQLANFVAGEPIPDINSGLRIFHKPVAQSFQQILPDGFSFTTTITLAMLTNNYRVDYLPINYAQRIGRSKIRPIRDTLNFIQLILRIGLYFSPLKIFLPVSGVLFVISFILALFTHFVLGQLADISTLVIFMTAIQIGTVGLLAELINQRLENRYRIEDHDEN